MNGEQEERAGTALKVCGKLGLHLPDTVLLHQYMNSTGRVEALKQTIRKNVVQARISAAHNKTKGQEYCECFSSSPSCDYPSVPVRLQFSHREMEFIVIVQRAVK